MAAEVFAAVELAHDSRHGIVKHKQFLDLEGWYLIQPAVSEAALYPSSSGKMAFAARLLLAVRCNTSLTYSESAVNKSFRTDYTTVIQPGYETVIGRTCLVVALAVFTISATATCAADSTNNQYNS